MSLRSRFVSVASFLPPKVVKNDDLTQFMDTSDEWIKTRSGISERRWVEGQTNTSDLALEACNRALSTAGIDKKDIDLLVLATLSPDYDFPGTACFLQAKLGVPGIPALDIRQQCTGFIHAVAIADSFIRTGQYRRALVVGSEVHSRGLDISTRGRDVAVLFGDGAGAAVIEAVTAKSVKASDKNSGPIIYSTHLHADGAFAKELWAAAPGSACGDRRLTVENLEAGDHFPKMNGRSVFMHASKRMPEAIMECVRANGVKLEDVDLFVFHQANQRINEMVAKQLEIPADKVFNTIERFGNTTAATIPIGMDEAVKAGRLKPGMLVASAAFGSGFTWASMLFRW